MTKQDALKKVQNEIDRLWAEGKNAKSAACLLMSMAEKLQWALDLFKGAK